MSLYIPELSNLEGHTRIGLTAEQPRPCCVHVQFETEVLVALEDRIFHNLPDNILQLTRPEIEILVPIDGSLPQVEGLKHLMRPTCTACCILLCRSGSSSLESNSGLQSISMVFLSSISFHLSYETYITVYTSIYTYIL